MFYKDDGNGDVPILPPWQQGDSLILSPCHYVPNPLQPQPSFLVLCESRDSSGNIPVENTRALVRDLPDPHQAWWTIAQAWEGPLGLYEKHFDACLDAGLMIVAAGPGWYTIGFRDFPSEVDADEPSALVVADHLLFAQYLLTALAKQTGAPVLFTGIRLNLSTNRTRLYREREVERLADKLLRKTELKFAPGHSPVKGIDHVRSPLLAAEVYSTLCTLLQVVNLQEES